VQSILKLVDERLSEDRTTPDLATYFHKGQVYFRLYF